MPNQNCCSENSQKIRKIFELRKFLRTISDTNRLRILCLLTKEEHCVCEIFKALQLPQNLVSHHLGKLKRLSLVTEKKEGTFIIYSVNYKALKRYKALFNQIIKDQTYDKQLLQSRQSLRLRLPEQSGKQALRADQAA